MGQDLRVDPGRLGAEAGWVDADELGASVVGAVTHPVAASLPLWRWGVRGPHDLDRLGGGHGGRTGPLCRARDPHPTPSPLRSGRSAPLGRYHPPVGLTKWF